MKMKPIAFTNLARAEVPEALRKVWAQARTAERPKAAATEFLVYDVVGYDWWTGGGVTAQGFAEFLAKLPDGTEEITVRINSPGGDVFEGIAIYNAMINSGKRVNVIIDALAASIASVIAMAGDHIAIAGNGQVMIHRAWTITAGNANDHRQQLQALESIDGTIVDTYAARTGGNPVEIAALLDAETYLNPSDAISGGFVDEILPLKGKSKSDPPPDTAAAAARKAKARMIAAKMQLHLMAISG